MHEFLLQRVYWFLGHCLFKTQSQKLCRCPENIHTKKYSECFVNRLRFEIGMFTNTILCEQNKFIQQVYIGSSFSLVQWFVDAMYSGVPFISSNTFEITTTEEYLRFEFLAAVNTKMTVFVRMLWFVKSALLAVYRTGTDRHIISYFTTEGCMKFYT